MEWNDGIELAVLTRARQLIAKPENWTQHVLGRDKRGLPEFPGYGRMFAFCALGAGIQAAHDMGLWSGNYSHWHGESYAIHMALFRGALLRALPAQARASGVAAYNNSHSHEEVLAVFDRAIADLRARLGVSTQATVDRIKAEASKVGACDIVAHLIEEAKEAAEA